MGEVYLAEDLSLGRKVALKFLPASHTGDDSARERLLREAQAAASLDHPFICKVYEVGVSDDHPFIAMEYVDGTALNEKLAAGGLPVEEAVRLASEIAEALDFAHARRIVHRDLKPANIMLTSDGHVKVMDFGVAKRLTSSDTDLTTIAGGMTAPGEIVGTPAYMSPEQLRGEPVDARSDVFAFGLVLYEMLTGTHPFRATTIETASAILNEPQPGSERLSARPGTPRARRRPVPGKEPAKRYQSLGDVRTELEVAGEHVAPCRGPAACRALAEEPSSLSDWSHAGAVIGFVRSRSFAPDRCLRSRSATGCS